MGYCPPVHPEQPVSRLPTFRTFRTYRTAAPLQLELLKLNDITFSYRRNSAGTPQELRRNSAGVPKKSFEPKRDKNSGTTLGVPKKSFEPKRDKNSGTTPKEFLRKK
jgi:hypothetical protein